MTIHCYFPMIFHDNFEIKDRVHKLNNPKQPGTFIISIKHVIFQFEDSEDNESGSSGDEEKAEVSKVYKPPKLAAMHYGTGMIHSSYSHVPSVQQNGERFLLWDYYHWDFYSSIAAISILTELMCALSLIAFTNSFQTLYSY